MNSNVLLTCRGNDNEADEPAAAAEADMEELDLYAAGVEREEVEAATPSGSATSAALGYADPPPVKKQKERPRTKTECKRVVAAELLESGMTPSQVSEHLDCTAKFLRTMKRLMEKKRLRKGK